MDNSTPEEEELEAHRRGAESLARPDVESWQQVNERLTAAADPETVETMRALGAFRKFPEPPPPEPDAPPPPWRRRFEHQFSEDIEVRPPVWIWEPWLPEGILCLLIGEQKSGKSILAAWLAVTVARGGPWPDGSSSTPYPVGMLSLEEPGGERLAARLKAQNAPPAMIDVLGHVEDRKMVEDQILETRAPWRMPDDCDVLEDVISKRSLRLVTIDGLGHSLSGDSHNYNDVGKALSALAGVAERTRCSILGVTHSPKGGGKTKSLAIGSTAWTCIPRLFWELGRDPTDDNPEPSQRRRLFAMGGTNFAEPVCSWTYDIEGDLRTGAGRAVNLQASDEDAESIVSDEKVLTALEKAREWLTSYLVQQEGSVKATTLLYQAEKQGISQRTIERARSELLLRREKRPDGWWFLL